MLRLNLTGKYAINCYQRWRHCTKYCHHSSIATKFIPSREVLGYCVKKVEEVPELNLTAVLLEHKTTGAEHLHLSCDDSNNVFGVSFRTPPSSSNGVPHILEHLALCGSRKYPCRDPFFNMLNRSLQTFMNAFTGADSTVYAFSTQNRKDYQNLLSVYLDAAFFPLLNEKDFRQEGWRLEHEDINNKNSPIVFKGVVFNEMKGVFSDPNTYYYYNIQQKLFPTNTYSNVSGGIPLDIPTLTWEDLKQFHKHHYHPSNSKFITYGNMPLEEHLEQIEESVLKHFEKLTIENEISDVVVWTEPREAYICNKFNPMAAVKEKQTVVSQSFLLDKITNSYESFALAILGTLLAGGPNSPFYQKLLESDIGPNFSPGTGYSCHLKQSLFSVGLREIAEKDVDHVKEIIAKTFDEVINTGFPDERIKEVLHHIEISTKHRTGNFGLSCALGVKTVWNHNGCPITSLKVNDHVQWFLKQLKENPTFFQDKIVQYFKNNQHKLTLIMSPSEAFEIEQKQQEEKLLKSKLSKLSDFEKLQIYNDGLELSKHQAQVNASCLPTIKIEDVKREIERTPLKFLKICDIPVQICEQPTNEVVYFRGMLDASFLDDEQIILLPLFCSVITRMGAGKRNYKQLDQEIQLKTAGFSVSFNLSENPSDPKHFQQNILISSYCLERNMPDMLALWKDIINEACLADENRLSQLIKMFASGVASGITHRGHSYAMVRASSGLSACASVREKSAGITQISYMKKLAEMDTHTEILEKLKKLYKILLKQKFLKFSINATPSAMPSALNNLDSFISDVDYCKSSNYNANQVKFSPQKNQKSHFVFPLSVNYLGQSILTVPFCDPNHACLKVAAKLLSSKFLHAEIREKGGAYGGGATLNKGGHFLFYSYRDPNVDKTLRSFSSGINWLLEGSYSSQDIDEAKLGVFSGIDSPIPPGSKGQMLFQDEISDDMKEAFRLQILNCKKEDIISAVQRYLENSQEIGTTLVGPENPADRDSKSKNTWTIITE